MPWYLMASQFGWIDSYWGIMFPGMMTAFGTFLMKQFFESVPDDFLEAARIDGLNEFTDLVEDRHAAGDAGPVGARDLHLPRQLDGLLLAADRHHERGALHAAGRPLQLRGGAIHPVGNDHDRRKHRDASRPSSSSSSSSATSSAASCWPDSKAKADDCRHVQRHVRLSRSGLQGNSASSAFRRGQGLTMSKGSGRSTGRIW